MQFKPKSEYVPELSPNRRTLAELLDAKADLSAERDTLAERLSRLDRAQSVLPPLTAELDALNASEAAEMAAWAEAADDSEPPAPDLAKRADLAKKLATARASVAAIDSATTGVREAASRNGVALAALQPQITVATALVELDEMRTFLPRLAEKIQDANSSGRASMPGRSAVSLPPKKCPRTSAAPSTSRCRAFDREMETPSRQWIIGSALPPLETLGRRSPPRCNPTPPQLWKPHKWTPQKPSTQSSPQSTRLDSRSSLSRSLPCRTSASQRDPQSSAGLHARSHRPDVARRC